MYEKGSNFSKLTVKDYKYIDSLTYQNDTLFAVDIDSVSRQLQCSNYFDVKVIIPSINKVYLISDIIVPNEVKSFYLSGECPTGIGGNKQPLILTANALKLDGINTIVKNMGNPNMPFVFLTK